MKNLKQIPTLIIIALALLTSCKVQKEKLELNLTKGETYYQNMISNATVIQTLNGQQMNMNMSLTAKMSYKINDLQDSIYRMEVRYETMSIKLSLPNGIMEFSSEKKDEKDVFSSILKILKNRSFSIKMTKTGKITEVRNVDSLFLNMFDKFPQLTNEQKQQIQSQIMGAYGEKAFKGNLEMVSAIFSNAKVSKGDKWIIKTQLESGMSANMETTYQLKEVTGLYDRIKGDSKIITEDKDAYVQSNGTPIKYNLNGTMFSDIKIDKKTGWIIDAKINQTISGTAQIKDNPKVPGGMTIPMTMKNEMTITNK